jgi:hypothetical protein
VRVSRRGAVRRANRYRPAKRRTRSAASALGLPVAVTNSGRAEDPRTTGTAWVAVRNRDLATPITGMSNAACACAPRPGFLDFVDQESGSWADVPVGRALRRRTRSCDLARDL